MTTSDTPDAPDAPDAPDTPSTTEAVDESADDRLLARLGAIADVVDPVPDQVLAAGRALFAFRDPDAELLTALAVDSDRLEAVRGTAPLSRMHFFELGELSLDIEVTSEDGLCGLVGVLTDGAGSAGSAGSAGPDDPRDPGARGRPTDTSITVDTPWAAFTTAPDADGRFVVRGVPRGVARITLWRADRTRIATPWFEIGWSAT